jgi:aminotransferase
MKPSGIRIFFEIAATRKGCISLGVGEPDFVTPKTFSQAGIDSILDGKTQYTANAGLMSLRQEIAKYLKGFIGVDYDPASEVILTVGASEGLDAAFRTICAPGDEVLIPEPCFVCYSPLVQLTGATPVPVKCRIENEFRLMPEDVEAAITDKTKAILIAFPNNPTGGVMEKADLEKLVPIIKKNNLIVFSDEIYGELVYNGLEFTSIASLEGMRERTIVISGFSKSFAMTGWRLGYIAAPKEIVSILYKIHQFGIMCAPTMAQYAALAALQESAANGFKEVNFMKEKYDERRRYLVDRLNAMGLTCFEPRGAFYAFPCVKSTGLDGESFAYKLLDAKNVAVVPGGAFGESGKDFIRISYAYSIEEITKALDLMEEFVNEIKK